MVTPSVGAVVLVRFPFSDLTASKLRPAVVLANAERGDWVLCQVTSQIFTDPRSVEIVDSDFDSGSLKNVSYARPGKLFTANSNILVKKIGELSPHKTNEIVKAVLALFENSLII